MQYPPPQPDAQVVKTVGSQKQPVGFAREPVKVARKEPKKRAAVPRKGKEKRPKTTPEGNVVIVACQIVI